MDTKFTPGPWTYEIIPCGKFFCANIGIEGHRKIATIWPIDWDEDYDPTVFPLEANAKLIASAPEMYAALQLAQSLLREIVAHFEGADAPLGARARAALAKVQP